MSQQTGTGIVQRHALSVRIAHWINAIAFFFLVVSGGGIIMAHPEFYWGMTGYYGDPAFIRFPIEPNFRQAMWSRNYHFLFAWVFVLNGLIYLVSGLVRGGLFHRMLPTREQLTIEHMSAAVRDRLRFKKPEGEDARGYNLVQKAAYLVVLFLICPLMLVSGLTMSPATTSVFPELLTFFGGRQSARTIHFLAASTLVLFFVVHLVQVFVAGARNQIRAMITGRLEISREKL